MDPTIDGRECAEYFVIMSMLIYKYISYLAEHFCIFHTQRSNKLG